jgi:S-methylmethionine-dependent homocysteine/selenocysteine methylase
VVADGAMGTMLQASDATVDDFAGYEGCNEILNVTRPDIVTGIHEAYLDAGADCVTTNSPTWATWASTGSRSGSPNCPRRPPGSPAPPQSTIPPRLAHDGF